MEVRSVEGEINRWERIDGTIFNMSSPPTSDHQRVVSKLQGEFCGYLKHKTRQSFVAPFGVHLDGYEDGNYVEPDITIVCDPDKIRRRGCFGAPDLVVEVLSPATAAKDKRIKLKRYRLSGVREYWIIDPMNQYLEVYMFSDNKFAEPQVYACDEVVSVGICDGLEINLKDIFANA